MKKNKTYHELVIYLGNTKFFKCRVEAINDLVTDEQLDCFAKKLQESIKDIIEYKQPDDDKEQIH